MNTNPPSSPKPSAPTRATSRACGRWEKEISASAGISKKLERTAMMGLFLSWGLVCEASDLALSGTQHQDVTATYGTATLNDSSTLAVLPGGYVGSVLSHGNAGTTIGGGTIGNSWPSGGIRAYDSSTVTVNSGEGGFIFGYNTSTVNVRGGSVSDSFYDYALRGYDNSTLNISGGTVVQVWAGGSSTVNITGGLITYQGYGSPGYYTLWAVQSSTVNVSGGTLDHAAAASNASIRFYGYDFQATGGLLLDGEHVIGTGTLSGKWFDNTPWTTTIVNNPATATILAISEIPEPSTLAVLGLGAAALIIARRRTAHRG
jgi:hypothetical protein